MDGDEINNDVVNNNDGVVFEEVHVVHIEAGLGLEEGKVDENE